MYFGTLLDPSGPFQVILDGSFWVLLEPWPLGHLETLTLLNTFGTFWNLSAFGPYSDNFWSLLDPFGSLCHWKIPFGPPSKWYNSNLPCYFRSYRPFVRSVRPFRIHWPLGETYSRSAPMHFSPPRAQLEKQPHALQTSTCELPVPSALFHLTRLL